MRKFAWVIGTVLILLIAFLALGAFVGMQRKSSPEYNACVDKDSREDRMASAEIARLVLQVDEYAGKAKEANVAGNKSESIKLYEKAEALNTKLQEVDSTNSKRQFALLTKSEVDKVYTEYCGEIDGPNFPVTTKVLTPSKLAAMSLPCMICSLDEKLYSENDAGSILQLIGLRYAQNLNYDEAFKMYMCAGKKYFNRIAMYRLAQIYYFGSEEFKQQYPDSILTMKIEKDPKQAYFWILSFFIMDKLDANPMTNSLTAVTSSALSILDTLQETNILKADEKNEIGNKATEFLSKKYPNGNSVFNK